MKTIIPLVFFLVLLLSRNSYSQINVGDTLQFWSVAYIDWQPNPPIEQRVIDAVCQKVGDQCYIFFEIGINNPPSQQQVDELVEIFDTNFAVHLPPFYGPIPDEFDNDLRIFILIVPNEG